MRSRLCILETVEPLKIILDYAMSSKIKNIYRKKTSLFYPQDGFHPKKLHGLSEEPNPFELQNLSYKICVTKFELQNLSYKI